MVCWSKNAQKEERLADPGSRGEDSNGVEGEDESESEKRRGVPSLRERLPMSAGLGVKVDSIFFRQMSPYRSPRQFNAQKVEFEINDENTINHLYEIKTSGKYIDRFRMLIIPDKEEDELEFDMILETETPPSINIIRNPKATKGSRNLRVFTIIRI
ncbi:hypothetical protein LOTGIDRAFT_161032 [Lottia gigantea]|uniref:Uncharacterized protein n=1 Tax=Lottia gigantea TaxID=225164 RepID=V4AMD1_LOTGI|nr:hypothetical protein LOTGIDRAFT_161032 [Lottia gigantea]ESO94781.1 hypothetical protein LOTGIDRAFT_161032 [Lottia gigantea]